MLGQSHDFSSHRQWNWWWKNKKMHSETKMSIMSPILWESFTCVLKMNWVLVFPRLLRFQKWLGFMMFDVNSCSNWACKLGTVPRLAKWTQMTASCLNQKIAGKVASLWDLKIAVHPHPHLHPFFWPRSVILRCLTRLSAAVTDAHFLSSRFPYHSFLLLLKKAGESVSPSEETE